MILKTKLIQFIPDVPYAHHPLRAGSAIWLLFSDELSLPGGRHTVAIFSDILHVFLVSLGEVDLFQYRVSGTHFLMEERRLISDHFDLSNLATPLFVHSVILCGKCSYFNRD